MTKLQTVTSEEVAELTSRLEDIMADCHNLANRLEKGRTELAEPVANARTFIGLSRVASTVAGLLLLNSALQEQKTDIERMVRENAQAERS